jgi:putative endonuclease
MAETGPFFVYILRYSDGNLYVGHSTNLSKRMAAHNAGRGAKWTRCRTPVELAYQDSFSSEADAVARERQIKKWTRAKKKALAEGDLPRLQKLSKSN